jgi:hypothetical protein
MIFGTTPDDVANARARFRAEAGEEVPAIYASASDNQCNPSSFELFGVSDAPTEFIQTVEVTEDPDWSDPKQNREYIDLEQKTLAGKASEIEQKQYQILKVQRDAAFFADRFLSDYAEMQRLQLLAKKLEEVKRLIKLIKI